MEHVMELAEIYEKTADVIEERGLAANTLQDAAGRVCLFGAVHLVLYGVASLREQAHGDGRCAAFECDIVQRLGESSALDWSDRLARTHVGDVVVARLREFAAEVRAGASAG